MIENIIVAVDYSTISENAAKYALSIAAAGKSRVTLVNGTHIPLVSDVQFDITASLDAMHAESKVNMKNFASKLRKKFSGVKITEVVEVGFVGEIIRKMAKKSDSSMVVMGIGKYDKFSEVVFGSTSTALAGTVGIPVIIVPEGYKYRPIGRMCLAFDGNKVPANTGIKSVADIAATFGSKMYYAHVMDEAVPIKDDSSLKSVYTLLNDEERNVHFLKNVKGKTVELIEDFGKRYKINLMIMVAREHNFLWRLMNERNTKKMAFTTTRPLMVLAEKRK
jgi:nucleotide-binding universal stress UspA family protein